jgi:hypothetical protein
MHVKEVFLQKMQGHQGIGKLSYIESQKGKGMSFTKILVQKLPCLIWEIMQTMQV